VTRYVALLRGINVGGNNILPMKDLVRLFEDEGCANVANYIQSGNIVFDAPAVIVKRLPTSLGARIRKRFGFEAPILLRSAARVAAVARHNPFGRPDAAADGLYVAFLATAPSSAAVAALDPNRSPPDSFLVKGEEIYLRLVSGAGKTKLTNVYFDRALQTISTVRNWRTVLKLAEMANGRSP
jgi:uncharacterized protein (DUF1697 family)